MQWLDVVFKFLAKIFKSDAFKKKYKTKPEKKFLKCLNSSNWQVIDLRNELSYQENHISGTINISKLFFRNNYYKKIDRTKKVLILNRDFHSDLDIYKILKQKSFKVYILTKNYYDLVNDPIIDRLVNVIVY
ncbi:rhodanese-like domain-containing protein [Spiroplasma clarkii]|uniref:Rhodanese domain-containing protein n=1 Tax=Spiroplasma clarkii TaxID=2139 RepID=A0A2K8KIT3_9MOLU|nr:rhodanese-like domain-containing protein [Spiroplasma clarkii]ATX71605.1 hypothetical protein SCLAR_v1c13070 [Spiroplasma clarkii]